MPKEMRGGKSLRVELSEIELGSGTRHSSMTEGSSGAKEPAMKEWTNRFKWSPRFGIGGGRKALDDVSPVE